MATGNVMYRFILDYHFINHNLITIMSINMICIVQVRKLCFAKLIYIFYLVPIRMYIQMSLYTYMYL